MLQDIQNNKYFSAAALGVIIIVAGAIAYFAVIKGNETRNAYDGPHTTIIRIENK